MKEPRPAGDESIGGNDCPKEKRHGLPVDRSELFRQEYRGKVGDRGHSEQWRDAPDRDSSRGTRRRQIESAEAVPLESLPTSQPVHCQALTPFLHFFFLESLPTSQPVHCQALTP